MNWEYTTLHVGRDINEAGRQAMTRLGLDGWELACVTFDQAVFKRPVAVAAAAETTAPDAVARAQSDLLALVGYAASKQPKWRVELDQHIGDHKPGELVALLWTREEAEAYVNLRSNHRRFRVVAPFELPTTSVATGPRSPGEYASRPDAIDPSAKRTTIDADDLPSADEIVRLRSLVQHMKVAVMDTTSPKASDSVRALFRNDGAALDWIKDHSSEPKSYIVVPVSRLLNEK